MKMTSRLMKSDSGAVMVMATFVAVFMVALVYHVAGVGHAAIEQQVVQDAADSVAYSSAAAKARGMNIIALINLVMAAVMSILVALRVLQAILTVAIVVVGVACVVTQGAACGAMVPLGKALDKVMDIADDVEPRIKDVLEGLEKASNAVSKTVPVLAEAEAVYISTRAVYDPVEIGFAWPIMDELPVKEGSFEELCERAGENVVVACTFLLPGDLPEFAQDTVGELVGGVAGSFTSFFCGGSDSPPADEMTRDVAYPLNDHPECDDSSGRPNEWSGGCDTALCDTCSAWGCTACIGKQESNRYGEGLWTRRKDVWVEWVDSSGQISKSIESTGAKELVWIDDDPCEGGGVCGGEVVCFIEDNEDAGSGYPDGAQRVTRTEYPALHSCLIEETLEVEVQGEPLDPDDWPKPKALDDEQLPEGLRVRGFVIAGTGYEGRMRKVGIAGSGHDDVDAVGRIGFAAADFTSGDMDLWHMSWRSRLIRFRMPSSDEGFAGSCDGEFSSECQSVGSQTDTFFDGGGGANGLTGLEGLVLH